MEPGGRRRKAVGAKRAKLGEHGVTPESSRQASCQLGCLREGHRLGPRIHGSKRAIAQTSSPAPGVHARGRQHRRLDRHDKAGSGPLLRVSHCDPSVVVFHLKPQLLHLPPIRRQGLVVSSDVPNFPVAFCLIKGGTFPRLLLPPAAGYTQV